eukprot:26405-Pelagococcus_subviridis.AAC.2
MSDASYGLLVMCPRINSSWVCDLTSRSGYDTFASFASGSRSFASAARTCPAGAGGRDEKDARGASAAPPPNPKPARAAVRRASATAANTSVSCARAFASAARYASAERSASAAAVATVRAATSDFAAREHRRIVSSAPGDFNSASAIAASSSISS